ncbi:hypothetical protein PybrP1_002776 [[Pythium] brassicae (nom. inval.)]|nr:hypothetical protein PybrP1_002776 [[Pythium] brassicae (nom. inval.)]
MHYKKDGSLDMRYSSSRAAASSSSSYGGGGGGGSSFNYYSSASRYSASSNAYGGSSSSLHYKKDGTLDMRYSSSKAALAPPSSSPFSGSSNGYSSYASYSGGRYAGQSTATPPPAPAPSSGLHYKKDGSLDMRYASSQAAVAAATAPSAHSTPKSASVVTPTSSAGLNFKNDGTLDMRYKSSQAVAATIAHGASRSSSTKRHDAEQQQQQLHYKKDGTLDMRYKSSQEVVARQLQQLDLAAAKAQRSSTKRSTAAAPQRQPTRGVPSHVPVTKAGYPDLRTRAAKDWVLAEASAWHDAAPLPDGSPDTTKTATRAFFARAAPPPPPRRDEYYAERLLDAVFQQLVARERERAVPRLRAPELLPDTAVTRLALQQIHQPAETTDATVHGLPSSVQLLDYARDLVVNEADAPLGRGSFGVVLRGSWRGTSVAVKRLHAAQLTKRERKMFSNETLVLGVLGAHPNVVQLFGYTLSPPALVMEFVPRGSLSFVLHYCEDPAIEAAMTDGRTSSSTSSHVLTASGSSVRNESAATVARNDDGDDDDVDQEGAACGTAAYMAPELLNPLEVTNERTDVYSFGVLMNELLHEEEPYYESLRQFAGKGPFAAVLAAMSGQRPVVNDKKVTPELRSLIEQCWSERAPRRPTFVQIAERLARCSGVPNSCA